MFVSFRLIFYLLPYLFWLFKKLIFKKLICNVNYLQYLLVNTAAALNFAKFKKNYKYKIDLRVDDTAFINTYSKMVNTY